MNRFKLLFAVAVLILALAPVGAQDATTISMWFGESEYAQCITEVVNGFN